MNRLFLLLVALLLSGCGTIIDAGNFAGSDQRLDSSGPHVYGGVRFDALMVADPGDKASSFAFLFFLDLPISLGMDTAFLLFTVPWALFGPETPPK